MTSYLGSNKIFKNLSHKVSIKNRIFLGFLSIALIVTGSYVFSLYSLNKLYSNFTKLDQLNNDTALILEIDRLTLELQSDVSKYTYTGSENVKGTVFKLVNQIKESMKAIESSIFLKTNIDLEKRFSLHLNNYQKAFEQAAIEFELKQDLINKKKNEAFSKLGFSDNKVRLFRIDSLMTSYLSEPSGVKALEVSKQLDLLIKESDRSKRQYAVDLKETFLRTKTAFKSYLYLINVVMAAEAFEVRYISNLMKLRTTKKALQIKKAIDAQNIRLKTLSFLFLLFFIPFVLIFSWRLSLSISGPILKITQTLEKITSGETKVEIPGKNRGDEIGVLSRAADIYRQRTDSLERSNSELNQFAYRTSHDLKAPLVSILGLTDLVAEDINSGDIKEAKSSLEKINFSAKKLSILIKDILSLSKADSLDGEIEVVNLYDLVKEIEVKLAHLFKENDVALEYDSLKAKTIVTHRVRFEQVIENLISNSVKYCDPAKPNRYVRVSYEGFGGLDEIIVSDNGLGIDQKYIGDLFDMFKRFHTNVSFGSGLGLYLVKKHLDVMNKEIFVKSKKGLGTNISVKNVA